MVDFSKLKSLSKNSLEKTKTKIEAESKSSYQKDETEWKPTLDKAGNASAVIRFLPVSPKDLELDEDALPYVKTFRHGFSGPGGWYIEESLTTLGQNDPVSDYNTKLWNAGKQDQARAQKRKLSYVSNIEVISDPGAPENEGKIFKFRYGKKIFEKIMAAMNGDEEAEIEAFDPFNFYEGANFRVKVKTISVDNKKMPNYDDSAFLARKPHHNGDDRKLEQIWKQEYSLKYLVDPSNPIFKPYSDLQAKLNKVLGLDGNTSAAPTAETTTVSVKGTPVKTIVKPTEVDVPWDTSDEKSSDTLKYFQDLVDED